MLANKGGGTLRGGAGGGDAYTVMLSEEMRATRGPRDCRQTGPIVSQVRGCASAPAVHLCTSNSGTLAGPQLEAHRRMGTRSFRARPR